MIIGRTLAVFAVVCGLAPAAWGQVKVVASFSILADMAATIGQDRVAVRSIVGPEADAHVHQPTPADARALKEADIVIVNGLGFEGWFDRLVRASGTKARIVVASEGVARLAGEPPEDDRSVKRFTRKVSKPAEKADDPHAWQDARNGALYVGNIVRALGQVDPGNAEEYRRAGEAYVAAIMAADAEIREVVAKIPEAKRKVITSHEAFRYFGAAYGVEFLAVQGVSTEAEATAKDIAKLVEQVRQSGVKALFVENISDRRMIHQIAREAGGIVGPPLFSDALSKPGGPADGYLKMLRHNAAALAAGMAKN